MSIEMNVIFLVEIEYFNRLGLLKWIWFCCSLIINMLINVLYRIFIDKLIIFVLNFVEIEYRDECYKFGWNWILN